MDGELLATLYHRLFGDDTMKHTFGYKYPEAVVLLIHFFAVLTNHSLRWAHDKRNWPLWCRRLSFPSYSQLCKRLKKPPTLRRVAELDREFRAALPAGKEKVLDGKPLVVGGYTKDKDAALGRVPDGWARGYKVHALVDAESGCFEAFEVTSLEAGEPTTAVTIVGGLDLGGDLVRGDSNFDSNALYAAVAGRGGRLVAPRKKPGTGLGKGSAHHPHRLEAIKELEGSAEGLKEHKRRRNCVEQRLAHLTNVPFGVWALPNHVRRLPRVRRWVATKIMLYHLYLRQTRAAAKAAAA